MINAELTNKLLEALGYRANIDFELRRKNSEVVLIRLSDALLPTAEQLDRYLSGVDALPSGITFQTWLAEHGGNPLLTKRRQALDLLNDNDNSTIILLKAFAAELLPDTPWVVLKNKLHGAIRGGAHDF